MKDRKGKTLIGGEKVMVDVNGRWYRGTVIGFEQVGTIHENVLVANRTLGAPVTGKPYYYVANVWPTNIQIVEVK